MASIPQAGQKIKDFSGTPVARDIYVVLLIILASCASFGLGRMSVRESRESIAIEYDPQIAQAGLLVPAGQNVPMYATSATGVDKSNLTASVASAVAPATQSGGKYVASKKGKKYYAVSCSGAKTLAEANKIWFATVADAEKAGYTKSSSCNAY